MTVGEQFEALRITLFSLAYRMLGTRADAEDIVQETYLRWQAGWQAAREKANEIQSPKSYLTSIAARLCLDALKSAQRKRETYTGTWLPEPWIEPQGTRAVEAAESLSIAFLHVLETLAPAERVAFLLREVFEAEYAEIAAVLDTTETNCRQLVTRARRHLENGRPRFPVDPARHERILREFFSACATGDPAKLTNLLSEDVAQYSDGGGKVVSATQPVVGRDRVARMLAGIARKASVPLSIRIVQVNGEPGAIVQAGERIVAVVTIALDADARIRRVFFINNPDKLPAR